MDFSRRFQGNVVEARARKESSKKLRHVSSDKEFLLDLEKYKKNSEVLDKLGEVINHLKNRNDTYLVNYHRDHALERNYSGFRSCLYSLAELAIEMSLSFTKTIEMNTLLFTRSAIMNMYTTRNRSRIDKNPRVKIRRFNRWMFFNFIFSKF